MHPASPPELTIVPDVRMCRRPPYPAASSEQFPRCWRQLHQGRRSREAPACARAIATPVSAASAERSANLDSKMALVAICLLQTPARVLDLPDNRHQVHILIFSYSHILIFSYSHILIFSYSHTFILSYFRAAAAMRPTEIVPALDHRHRAPGPRRGDNLPALNGQFGRIWGAQAR